MNNKTVSIWKRYSFCGGMSIYGTSCTIDEDTQDVTCSCSKGTLKGYDWTIIYALMLKVDQGKVHLIDRMNKDKKLSEDEVWQQLSFEFNAEMSSSQRKTSRMESS